METSIRDSDYVLLICTPDFAKKANLGMGGVGYETNIVTGEIFIENNSHRKFIPVLRNGSPQDALPSYLKPKYYIDFRNPNAFQQKFDELLRHIYQEPELKRPPLGMKPEFSKNSDSFAILGETRSDFIEGYFSRKHVHYVKGAGGRFHSVEGMAVYHNEQFEFFKDGSVRFSANNDGCRLYRKSIFDSIVGLNINAKGRYWLSRDEIKITIITSQGSVDYEGKYSGKGLLLNAFSRINGEISNDVEYRRSPDISI
jgi:hypothetical protein